MPKKFGTNCKAAEARERKDTQKREKQESLKKQKEEEYWAETDKKVLAKEARKKEDEEKKRNAAAKKAEVRAMEEKEQRELAQKYSKPKDTKVTRAMIEEEQVKERAKQEASKSQKEEEEEDEILTENINHLLADQRAKLAENGSEFIDARSVNEALGQMNGGEADKHPEKRLKAAYLAYESKNLPAMRNDNPGLKLSQYKQMLWKQWQKAPENPLNSV